jgi:hypothetical protein
VFVPSVTLNLNENVPPFAVFVDGLMVNTLSAANTSALAATPLRSTEAVGLKVPLTTWYLYDSGVPSGSVAVTVITVSAPLVDSVYDAFNVDVMVGAVLGLVNTAELV